MASVYLNLEDRLLSNVCYEDNGFTINGEPSECWVWLGNVDGKGYGRISMRVPGQKHPTGLRAHRVSYEHFMGVKLREDETLDHKCRVHGCIHPNHLEPMSRAENTRLMRQYWAIRSKQESGQQEIEA